MNLTPELAAMRVDDDAVLRFACALGEDTPETLMRRDWSRVAVRAVKAGARWRGACSCARKRRAEYESWRTSNDAYIAAIVRARATSLTNALMWARAFAPGKAT